jgi:hypothetical protein
MNVMLHINKIKVDLNGNREKWICVYLGLKFAES